MLQPQANAQLWKELSHAMVAGLKKLQELIVVSVCCPSFRIQHSTCMQCNNPLAAMLQGTSGLSSQPVWLLGTLYGVSNHDTGEQTLTPEVPGPPMTA